MSKDYTLRVRLGTDDLEKLTILVDLSENPDENSSTLVRSLIREAYKAKKDGK